MSTATNGRAREYRVVLNLTKHGWRKVMRAAGSKGSGDLLMVHAVHGGALIQVGSRSKRLGPAERARLVADAADLGVMALLAVVVPGVGVRYHHVTNGVPASWAPWEPGEEAS